MRSSVNTNNKLVQEVAALKSALNHSRTYSTALEEQLYSLKFDQDHSNNTIQDLQEKVDELTNLKQNWMQRLEKKGDELTSLKHEHQQMKQKMEDELTSLRKQNGMLKHTVNMERFLKKKVDEELIKLTEECMSTNLILNKYKSNKYISEIFEMEEKLREKLFSIERKFSKEIDENRKFYNAKLEKYISEHSKCKDNLEDCGVVWKKSKFPNMVNCFRAQFQQNDDKLRKTFKVIYDIKQDSKSTLEHLNLKTLELINRQCDSLDNLQEVSFQNDLDQERTSFHELIRTAEEEIEVYINLYKTNARATTYFVTPPPAYRDVNNLNRPNSSNKATEEETRDNFNINAHDNALIIFNIAESETLEDDQHKIKHFLVDLGIREADIIFAERMGRKKGKKKVRAIKLILRNKESSKKVLERITAAIDSNIRAEKYSRR